MPSVTVRLTRASVPTVFSPATSNSSVSALSSSTPASGASSALIRVRSAPVSRRHPIGAASSPSKAMSTTGRGVSSPPLAAGSARKGNLTAGPRLRLPARSRGRGTLTVHAGHPGLARRQHPRRRRCDSTSSPLPGATSPNGRSASTGYAVWRRFHRLSVLVERCGTDGTLPGACYSRSRKTKAGQGAARLISREISPVKSGH